MHKNGRTQNQIYHILQPKKPDIRSLLKKYENLLTLTRKEAMKPQDIQITYSRSVNLKDLLTSGKKMNKYLYCANHVIEDTARPDGH